MNATKLAGGVVHALPGDLQKTLASAPKATAAWNDITPLARNEFICWVEDAKQPKTRARRIERAREELQEGKRRPCCWVGCVHRTDKAPGAWAQKVLLGKQSKGN